MINDITIAIIGLGYVGLPLAIEFGKDFKIFGFDINPDRILSLKKGIDKTLEVSAEAFTLAKQLHFRIRRQIWQLAMYLLLPFRPRLMLINVPILVRY